MTSRKSLLPLLSMSEKVSECRFYVIILRVHRIEDTKNQLMDFKISSTEILVFFHSRGLQRRLGRPIRHYCTCAISRPLSVPFSWTNVCNGLRQRPSRKKSCTGALIQSPARPKVHILNLNQVKNFSYGRLKNPLHAEIGDACAPISGARVIPGLPPTRRTRHVRRFPGLLHRAPWLSILIAWRYSRSRSGGKMIDLR